MVAGEGHLADVGCDAGNEAQNPDEQEHGSDGHGRFLDIGAGSSVAHSVWF
jgi:hypothetical protein